MKIKLSQTALDILDSMDYLIMQQQRTSTSCSYDDEESDHDPHHQIDVGDSFDLEGELKHMKKTSNVSTDTNDITDDSDKYGEEDEDDEHEDQNEDMVPFSPPVDILTPPRHENGRQKVLSPSMFSHATTPTAFTSVSDRTSSFAEQDDDDDDAHHPNTIATTPIKLLQDVSTEFESSPLNCTLPSSESSSPVENEGFNNHLSNRHHPHGPTINTTSNNHLNSNGKDRKEQKQPIIYTCPERQYNDPSGMVIHASSASDPDTNGHAHAHANQYQFAEEAILDPTWLDSDEEEEEDETAEEEMEGTSHGNGSTRKKNSNLNRPRTTSESLSAKDISVSSSSYASHQWSLGTGSSISVGSCGFGKISLCDMSIASSITSSIGSDSAIGNANKYEMKGCLGGGHGNVSRDHGTKGSRDVRIHHERNGNDKLILSQVDIVDMGVDSVSHNGSSVLSNHSCGNSSADFALDYLYDLDRQDFDLSEDEDEDDFVDGKATNRYIQAINAASVIGGQSDFELCLSDDEEGPWTNGDAEDYGVDCGDSNDYLPHCLVTPPKVRRQREPVTDGNGPGDGKGDVSSNPDRSPATCISAISIMKDSTMAEDDDIIVASIEQTPEMPVPVSVPESSAVQISPPTKEEEDSTIETILVTPDKTSPKSESVSLTCDNIGVGEEVSISAISKQLTTPQDTWDDQSASSSDETNICSNCSPSNPINLNEAQVGIISGDMVLSILDCPGSRTRKKRALRKRDPTNNIFKWGDHTVSETIRRMRRLRNNACEITPGELYNSSLAPEKTGRVLSSVFSVDSPSISNFSDSRGMNIVVSALRTPASMPMESPTSSKSLLLGSFRIFGNSMPSPHRSQHLESIAMEHLKNDEFEDALPIYHQILRIYKDQVELSQKYGESTDEFHTCVGLTLFNIGIVYMCKSEYSKALDSFEMASKKIAAYGCLEDCINIAIMRGHANYAMEEFHVADRHWHNAVNRLKKTKMPHNEVIAELLNNLGCVHFEIGGEAKALKYLKESLQVQKKEIMESVFDRNELLYQHTLVKLATTRANIGYITLRLKQADLAITSFDESLLDLDVCLDSYHNLVSATMDYLAMAHLRAGRKDDAINIYSKMLTAKIEADGPEHVECIAILTKISLLQVRGKDKDGVRSILRKIQQCVRENGPCQKERLERILKISKVTGLRPITARGIASDK